MTNRRFTLEQYAGALRQAGGNRTAAAAILGCPVATVHNIVRSHPDLKALCAPRRPSGPPQRYRPDQVADALRQAGGNRSKAARLLGCWKQTVDGYVRRYPEVRAALDACPPRLKSPDQVVDALRQAGGHRGRAAQFLGVTRGTLCKYIKRYPAVQEVCAALDQVRRKGPPQPVGRTYARRYSPEKVIEALRLAEKKGLLLLAQNSNLEYNAPMHVQVKLFSHLRVLLPAEAHGQISVELSDGATVAYLLAYLGIATQVKLVTVNNEPEPARDRILCDRDVVRIFPPVVGG